MVKYKYIAGIILGSLLALQAQGASWTTHYAYNRVSRIAMSSDKVFGLSDGNLFSVDKQTEQIKVYNRQSGLHGTGITCIAYDDKGKQLIIGYENGKIDIMSDRGVHYVSELYEKDMTQRKTIYNVTIQGRTAYLSTAYGIQTMNLNGLKLVDSYWLRPGGEETQVEDVLLQNDSIYAFTADSMFCAAMTDNLPDYHYWKRELRSERITPTPYKGVYCPDAGCDWWADSQDGIVRVTPTGKIGYKPDGPASNSPYRIRCAKNRVGMVPGGYDAVFYNRPGLIMIQRDNRWTAYDTDYISAHTGLPYTTDYCDIAFDPADPSHFFVANFGYGLFEFRKDTLYHHYTTTNSALESVLPNYLYPYVWVDGLQFDAEGNLWMLNVSNSGIKILKKDGNWVSLSNAACQDLDRSKELLFSVKDPKYKFISSLDLGIGVMNDNGTMEDESDDKAVLCNTFVDEWGNSFTTGRLSCMYQTRSGVLLFSTEEGLYRIDEPEEMLNGYRLCTKVHLDYPEEDLYDIFTNHDVSSIMDDDLSQVWVGTNNAGLFCLSSDLSTVLYHYSMDNCPISNSILSLQWNPDNQCLYVGTADGLVTYDPNGIPEGNATMTDDNGREWEMGSMGQWKMHLSYTNPTEIAATPSRIYGQAQGSIFYLDRATDQLEYLSRATGLKGNSASHIAYDEATRQLVIAYVDGRIDLLDDDDNVRQMPDLQLKAGAINVAIYCITPGTKAVYLGTSFGVMALNAKKAEITDTYYIGHEASSVEVQQIVELGDTLYAFSYDTLYRASLQDNLLDYTYWKAGKLPFEQVQQATVWKDELYVLADQRLYRRNGDTWETVVQQDVRWIHAHDGQMLVYTNAGLFRLTEEGMAGLSNLYSLNDGVFSNGEYWVAEYNFGLIRLSTDGDTYFHPAGPNSNYGYCMYAAHDQLYTSIGGRWGAYWSRYGRINIYDGQSWRNIEEGYISTRTGKPAIDICSLAIDPNDPGHFFAATYGTGVYEFRDYEPYTYYSPKNSTMREAVANIDPELYTFTDGAMMDNQGNLWVMNATAVGQPLHILQPNGQWRALYPYINGSILTFTTPTGIWMDRRNEQRKWMLDQRHTQGVILLDDGGTLTISSDDRCIKRASFTDQNGNVITPSYFLCFVQDKTDRIWIGTEKGIITIPSTVDFFTSDACKRIIIPRNDGSGLGDYLLGNEMINCMAIDGGNRLWIGTANSGLYVIEDDTITVAHFTENNSMLPSDAIQSIAIMPTTGDVFVGTDRGIASYRSDASEPQETMSDVYAFPNPVRPDFGGYISIVGLTENTTVNIIDSGGNLVCKTKSNGGTAIWDGKLADGRRATPGVYTALCNSSAGHTAVKILVVR